MLHTNATKEAPCLGCERYTHCTGIPAKDSLNEQFGIAPPLICPNDYPCGVHKCHNEVCNC